MTQAPLWKAGGGLTTRMTRLDLCIPFFFVIVTIITIVLFGFLDFGGLDLSSSSSSITEEPHCMFSANQCPPDTFGFDCEHDIFRHSSYLPDTFSVRNKTEKNKHFYCQIDLNNEKRTQELQNHITAIQESCYRDPLAAVTPYSVVGFATIMHYLSHPMTEAFERNNIFVLNDLPLINDLKDCTYFSCYFKRWTTCDIEKGHKFGLQRNHPYPYHVPTRYREKGSFWWKSNILAHYLQPNKKVEDLLIHIKKKLGWEHPIIGMHIRHGERCTDESLPACVPVQKYFEGASLIKKKYGVDRIFLATDDPQVKKEASKYSKDFKVVWVTDSMLDVNEVLGKHLPIDFSLATIVDLLLLSHSDYYVAGFISNQGRLAFEMMFARHGCLRPYVTVDIPWCSHYGHKWETGSIGVFSC
eukprot:TRINITY_DN15538_c0_g1_i1.p1 TRINITY_DN15538_c0_g1~~TRINITY_DN15538_c0_g1_i1.p1  ORF type:complete len:413 (-),score=62.48 TRINITY_DN15538_c0_g1_i1:88-1326(-)